MTEWVSKNSDRTATDIEIRGKKIPRAVVQILHNRGCATPEAIEKFFAPSLSDLHDPFLMNDMDKAVDRIIKAIHDKEKILIHGDYDTDGITGTALLISNLTRLGATVSYYIPHRLEEGYGLSRAGIEEAIKGKCSLLITLDCGSSALDEISYANTKNLDVIVCDHHQLKETLPDALAIINPKLKDSRYPFRELAGVGVAFKLAQALCMKMGQPEAQIYEDLDLVALGSVVDIVPLVDENRILVKYGLTRIPKSNKIGLQAMLKETGLKQPITAYHLGFVIGPRINACGRLRDAKSALELFLAQDMSRASELAHSLSLDNDERKGIEETIYREALQIVGTERREKDRIIITAKKDWHEGVLGIVASRVITDYFHPAIVLSLRGEIAKGSARSVPGFNITEAIGFCQNLLTKYGGHAQAAGLEMPSKNLDAFRACINDYAQGCESALFERKSLYDLELDLTEITPELVYFLKYFEPTGTANPQPVFLGKDFEVVGIPRVVGSNHLKIALRHKGKAFPAIAFGQAADIMNIEVGKTKVHCLYSVAEDSFFGKKKVTLKIREMQKAN